MGVLIFGDSGYTRQDERDGLEQSTGLAGVSIVCFTALHDTATSVALDGLDLIGVDSAGAIFHYNTFGATASATADFTGSYPSPCPGYPAQGQITQQSVLAAAWSYSGSCVGGMCPAGDCANTETTPFGNDTVQSGKSMNAGCDFSNFGAPNSGCQSNPNATISCGAVILSKTLTPDADDCYSKNPIPFDGKGWLTTGTINVYIDSNFYTGSYYTNICNGISSWGGPTNSGSITGMKYACHARAGVPPKGTYAYPYIFVTQSPVWMAALQSAECVDMLACSETDPWTINSSTRAAVDDPGTPITVCFGSA